MKDNIQRAYKDLKKQQYIKSLPTIYCGKYEDHHTNDLMESVDDQGSLDDVKRNYGYELAQLSTKDPKYVPIAQQMHDVLKNINDAPTHDDIHKLNRLSKDLDYHSAFDIGKQLIQPLSNVLPVTTEHEPVSSLYVPFSELKKTIDNGLRPMIGNVSKYDKPCGSYVKHIDGEHRIIPDHLVGSATTYKNEHEIDKETLKQLHDTHTDDLTPHTNVIQTYTEDSKEINKALADQYNGEELEREGWLRTRKQNLSLADDVAKAIKKSTPINKDFDVFTGLSQSSKIYDRSNSGTVDTTFHAPTFMSTSLNFHTAAEFAREKGEYSNNELKHNRGITDILHITIPANFKGGAYVDGLSSNKGELEYLLDKGHNFTIHKEPKYAVMSTRVHRVWKATIHPKDE